MSHWFGCFSSAFVAPPTTSFARALLRFIAAFVLSLILSLHATSALSDAQDTESKLNVLEASINKLQQWLGKAKGERSEVLKDLRATEIEIGTIAKKITLITREISDTRRRMEHLERQRAHLFAAKDRQGKYLSRQIRAAYGIGRQEYIKVLLNQERPDQFSRILRYYDYFNQARTEQINAYSATIDELRMNQQATLIEQEKLQFARHQLEQQKAELSAGKKQRRQVLIKLEQRIDNKDKELTKLISDREHLQELLEAVEQSLADIKLPDAAIPFAQLKGQLLWPAAGSLGRRFGSRDPQTGNRWNGVLIHSEEGREVSAIHHGRVIFADWLRGFGLLVIIDHGSDYMSLYGHNQSLFTEVGDWVSPSEVIATVGNSGGQTQSGLYFEIRHQGIPLNPKSWVLADTSR